MIGKTLGHYRIVEQLGRGGMGEVYLADDISLGRRVALKFLPDAFTGDPERMARFEREAKLLASLNHPNIAAIYGLEQAEGNRFLVLELVEGETLAQRLGKGPLAVEESLAVCRQIAEALAAAHEKGIIHRDLKPGNVMITEGEKVKILDFGLAKALSDETQSVDSSQSPTLTEAMTRPGVILGTAAYMSPEQAKGKTVDKRADIWAFGCILYECLTGKRIFEGETVTETLAAILKGEPDWQALPASTPTGIRFVLRRCLEKEVSRRLRDAADVRIEIEEAFTNPPAPELAHVRTSRALVAALVAISLAIGWGLAYLWNKSMRAPVATVQPTVTHIKAPADAVSAFHHGFALSPDGQTLIFSASTPDGRRQLWKRRLDNPLAQPIAGTDDGLYPFWSPDGRQIAFYVPNELRRMPAEGGQVQTICGVIGGYRFGTWGDNNEILFSAIQLSRTSIFRVPSNGGTPMLVPSLGDAYALHPQWLPGGRRFLFYRPEAKIPSGSIFAASIDGNPPPKLVAEFEIGSSNVDFGFFFSQPEYLFFNRAGALSVQRFDLKSLSLVGPAVPLTGLAGTPGDWFALTAARNGVAMLARESPQDTGNPGDPLARLKWLDRRGEIVGDLGSPGRYWTLRLSPDGLRAAVNPDDDIWILDPGNRRTRVTSRSEVDYCPVWSPDGSKLAFNRNISGLAVKPANLEGQESELVNKTIGSFHPTDWSRNGKYLLLDAYRESSSPDVWLYDFNEKSAKPWLPTKFSKLQARFSPDGNWVAYTSNVNGPLEVFLRRFNGAGDAIPISSAGGGRHPAWRGDGRELFYLNPKNELMAVSVADLSGSPDVGEPRRLFKVVINDIAGELSPYDVTPDGQRFLVNLLEPPEPLLFIQGIEELLKRGQ